MSAADLMKVYRIPARLVSKPTNLSAAFPYGGTELGRAKLMRFRWGTVYEEIIDEMWGEQVERSRIASIPFLAIVLEQWDDDILGKFVPGFNTTGGASGRIQGMQGDSGPAVVTAMDQLLLDPLDPESPALYIRRPIPCMEESAETVFALMQLAMFPLLCYPSRDSGYATIPPWQVATKDRILL